MSSRMLIRAGNSHSSSAVLPYLRAWPWWRQLAVAHPPAVAIAVKGQHESRRRPKLSGVAGGESRGGREDRMNFAIARGGNDCRHEVDFGDDPFEVSTVTSSAQGRWSNPRKPGWHAKAQPPTLGWITEAASMSVWYAVGIKIGSKADQVTIEAEDALIAALKSQERSPPGRYHVCSQAERPRRSAPSACQPDQKGAGWVNAVPDRR